MDPLSLTLGVSQLLGYTGKIIKYVNNVKDAPAERSRMTAECANLMRLLNDLRTRAEAADASDPWFRGVRALGGEGGPLDLFGKSLERIAKKLKPDKGVKKYGRGVFWPLSKQDTQDALAHLHRLQTLITATLAEDQFSLSLAMKKKIDELALTTSDLKRKQTLDWISTMTFASKQHDMLGTRTDGTRQWLLNGPTFQKWVDGEVPILWCPGIPAAGKTITASAVIEYLENKEKEEDVQVGYVYCNYKEKSQQTAINLVRSLTRQLVGKKVQVSPAITARYESIAQEGSTERPLKIGEWTEMLLEGTHNVGRVFIVVDALDECDESNHNRADFLKELRRIVDSKRVQLLITARPMRTVDLDTSRMATLEIQAHSDDIRMCLESLIDQEDRLCRVIGPDRDLRIRIVETITSKANGMFLAATLHLRSLASKHTRGQVRKALEQIPGSLDGIYEETMSRIEKQNDDDAQLAKDILCWITFALRPLKVFELLQALAVDIDEQELDPEDMPDAMTLVDVCAGLVTIDESSDVIRLVHFTTQEFFQRRRFPSPHVLISRACIALLGIPELRAGGAETEEDLLMRLERFPFLSYAATRWQDHVWAVFEEEGIDLDMKIRLRGLLKNQGSVFTHVQVKYWETERVFRSAFPRQLTESPLGSPFDITLIGEEPLNDGTVCE